MTANPPANPVPPDAGADFRQALLWVEGGNRYRLADVLGRGGMGVVYAAQDLHFDRVVAMKILDRARAADPAELASFVSEARITSMLEHPNIVPVHDLGTDRQGDAFYTMKRIRGRTLTDILLGLRCGDPVLTSQFPLGRLLTVFQKTCDAVAFAHARRVRHGDLKPDNIMVGDYGEVLVVDWGLARTLTGAPAPAPTAAGVAVALGSPGFMAPEQFLDGGACADERSDIYALGAILYSLLALRPPLTVTDNVPEVLRRIVQGEIEPPEQAVEGRFLPHCPDGKVPLALSQAALRAMATQPADRFQSVPELQAEVEAYQEGRLWHSVVERDFAGADPLRGVDVVGGRHEVRDGELRVWGGEPQLIILREPLHGDIRVEFECRIESDYLNDVGCFIAARRGAIAREIPLSGYEFKYGAYNNKLNVLTRFSGHIWQAADAPLRKGETYRVRAERVGADLSFWVNHRLVCRVRDPEPIQSLDQNCIGLLGWMSDVRYRWVRIYTLGVPWKSDVLEVAERHLNRGHYTTAMDLFEEVLEATTNAARRTQAAAGYARAKRNGEAAARLAEWQGRLRDAWPGTRFRLFVDSEGLTLEANGVGLSDLSPLSGLPLCQLIVADNRVESLEPLRGMALRRLHINGNPVASLEPLRGMPLVELHAKACRLSDLTPLQGMPLTSLTCAENPLGGCLEALRGLPLTWLSCVATGVETLEPLRGMRLVSLNCDANRIESLEPLRGMPLKTLTCAGNRLRSLEPLREAGLLTLHCGHNQIESLEPLRGMALTMLTCQANGIRSLAPLRGAPLSVLVCGDNPLEDLDGMADAPPGGWAFDSPSIATSELRRLAAQWRANPEHVAHARQAEVLIAVREQDREGLRARAAGHAGRRYLFIPMFLEWEAARRQCAELGGRLAVIRDAAANQFILSLFPSGSWFWIGLERTADGHRWITGEPMRFHHFDSIQELEGSGPYVFSNGSWCRELVPAARNSFLIEWDD